MPRWLSGLFRGVGYITLDPSPRLRRMRERLERDAVMELARTARLDERSPDWPAGLPLATGGHALRCPLDGTELTAPLMESAHTDPGVAAIVVTEPGTVHRHIRDAHPDLWQQMREQQRVHNERGTGMPRRADGCFLGPGEDVGDTP